MKNLWNNRDAKKTGGDPSQLLVYMTRLLGKDKSLVLHGGGNSSVKIKPTNIFGQAQNVLLVKGSGHDMATIETSGFCSVDLDYLTKFKHLESLSDEDMVSELETHKLKSSMPAPSVETFVHAFLPHQFICHTHAGAILALTNQKNGKKLLQGVYGEDVSILPYVMPGFGLAKQVYECYQQNPKVKAIIAMSHGIFTFGDDAKAVYSEMIEHVNKAETFITKSMNAGGMKEKRLSSRSINGCVQTIRGCLSDKLPEGAFYVAKRTSQALVNLSYSPKAKSYCSSGVVTTDHAVRIKNNLCYISETATDSVEFRKTVESEVDSYAKKYVGYVKRHNPACVALRDSLPRVFLIKGLGVVSVGLTLASAEANADIGEHTLLVKQMASAVGAYASISDQHIYDMEYWPLQKQKTVHSQSEPLQGQVAIVSGAGGIIGYGIADRLLAAGAAVAITDIDEKKLSKVEQFLAEKYSQMRVSSFVCDVTDEVSVGKLYDDLCDRWGGVDIVVPNAGIAHVESLENLDTDKLKQLIDVNLIGSFLMVKKAIPILKRQGSGGNVVLVSSKNVFAPGADFGAYSMTKAGAHQMARIASLELADVGVRVNMVNPDGVFGTENVSSGLWDLIGPDRMKSRNLDPAGLKEYYRNRNQLKVSVSAEHVGNAVVFFASNQTPTTGATLPVDGGVPGAAPR